jgi:hypothetical protein
MCDAAWEIRRGRDEAWVKPAISSSRAGQPRGFVVCAVPLSHCDL